MSQTIYTKIFNKLSINSKCLNLMRKKSDNLIGENGAKYLFETLGKLSNLSSLNIDLK